LVNNNALEEKLDGIVQLLQRSQAIQTQAAPIPATGNAFSPIHQVRPPELSNSLSFNNLVSVASTDQSARTSQGPPTPATSATSNPPENVFSCFSGPSPASFAGKKYILETEAELAEYLEIYRTEMISYFPIVPLEATATVKYMSEERPFLWLVIRAVCSKDWVRQRVLDLEIRQTLGKELLIEGTRSMDMLTGILVCAAWGHYFATSKPILQPIIMLAMSLAYDRGLTKPIPTDPVTLTLNFNTQGCPKPILAGQNLVRTLEERRTALGLFLMSSKFVHILSFDVLQH
jgi:hypothetical protein